MDLKVLFHNPDSLSDADLKTLQQKIRFQRTLPYLFSVFGGASMYLLNAVVLKRALHIPQIGFGFLAGYALGGYTSALLLLAWAAGSAAAMADPSTMEAALNFTNLRRSMLVGRCSSLG